jgi:SAM-dependent methyltransferase
VLALPAHRWLGPPLPSDDRVLGCVEGPVLDVGCGPGRHVLALAQARIVTLGIDVSPPALHVAHQRGAPVLHRSIFARIPGSGRWRTALLLDGNVGIGGCPTSLLRRVAALVAPSGTLLVEVDAGPAPRPASVDQVRFERGAHVGPWFAWTHVDERGLADHASAAGLRVTERWEDEGRRFARLAR